MFLSTLEQQRSQIPEHQNGILKQRGLAQYASD